MKPLYLSVEGINSFINKQEIDFERLFEDNIFCIYGATGAGKTTILDSIILALYGNGDRTDTVSEYISLDADKAEVAFRFELGAKIWEVRRTFKRKGTGKCSLMDITENVIIADGVDNVDKAVYALVKLKRNEFTQVVILEQGKFAKFLAAKKAERSTTVCRLFSLFKYENLHKKASVTADKFLTKMNGIEKTLLFFEGVDDGILKTKTDEITALKNNEKEQLNKLARLTKLASEQAALREKYEIYKKAGESIRVLEGRLSALNESRISLNGEIKRLERDLGGVSDAKKIIEKSAADLINIARLQELHSYYEGKQKEYDEAVKTKALTEESVKLLNEQSIKTDAAIVEKAVEFNSLLSELSFKFEVEINLEKSGNLGSQLSTAFERLNAMDKTLHLDKQKKQALKDKYGEIKFKTDNAKLKASDCQKALLSLKEQAAAAEKKTAELKTAESIAAAAAEKAMLENMAAHIGNGLHEGDVCPVCGGEFNACAAIKNENSATLKADAERLKQALVAADKERESVQNALSVKEQENKSIAADLESAVLEMQKIKIEFESVLTFGTVMSQEDYNRNIEISEKMRAVLMSISDCCRTGESLKSSIEAKINELKSAQMLIETIKSELTKRQESVVNAYGNDLLLAQKNALDSKTKAEERVRAYETDKERVRNQTVEIDKQEAACLSELEVHRQNSANLDSCGYDEELFRKTVEEKEECDGEVKSIAAAVAVCVSEAAALKNNLEKKQGLLKEYGFYKNKYDLAFQLKSMFKANKFLEFIEEDYIHKFTLDASKRLFDLTGGKYRLEYSTEDKRGDFFVIDYLCGGKKRNIKTLSGGETFLASLSLAMAISSHISAEQSYGFFFLDEGFGTLDDDTIGIVASALYKLSEETLVGVVSHRAELVERIPARLKVTSSSNSANGGSFVSAENA